MDAYYNQTWVSRSPVPVSRDEPRPLLLGTASGAGCPSLLWSSTLMVGLLLEVGQTLSPDTTRVKSLSIG